ncbi:MFS transporter [Marinobacter sp. LN3S78]|uniref:MFS transporter n=1 Tax=Marinobacter sp. LN3S78 TaxID=3382300 RepID=UPI00387AE01A
MLSNINGRLLLLALGAFSIGTEVFVIAGILPGLAESLDVTLSSAAFLITAFAFTYAVVAPIGGAFCARFPPRTTLIGALVIFGLANVAAAISPNYYSLLVARLVAAASAAIYTPAAVTMAIRLVPKKEMGRASSVVYGGLSMSLVTGVPIGVFIAELTSWRFTFAFVSLIALVAASALTILLKALPPSGGLTLKARLSPLGRPVVVATLLSGLIWMTGGIAVYTYIALFVTASGWGAESVSAILLLYGASAIFGNKLGGRLSDSRIGPRGTLIIALTVHFSALVLLGFAAKWGAPIGIYIAPLAIGLYAMAGWACTPPQAARLVSLAPQSSMEVLSLSTSATYFGIASGAALGSFVVETASLPMVAFVAAGAQIIALSGVVLFKSPGVYEPEIGVAESPSK